MNVPSLTRQQLAASLLLTAVCYAAASRVGMALVFAHPYAGTVSPQAGVAVAAVLLLGRRVWPAILASAFLVNSTTLQVPTSLAIAAGSTVEALLAALLVERFAGGPSALVRPAGVFRFTLLVALYAPMAGAAFAAAGLLAGGYLLGDQLVPAWLAWFLGDALGALLIAPLALFWFNADRRLSRADRRAGESVAFLAVVLLAGLLIFGGLGPLAPGHYPVWGFAVPVLVWGAFRLTPRVNATGVVLLSAIAAWGTLNGFGPFGLRPPAEAAIFLQTFLATIAATSLLVSAAVIDREQAREEAQASGETLRLLAERQRIEAALTDAQRIAHLGSWEWDVATDRVSWSDELCRIYGLEPGSFSGSYDSFLDHIHPEDRERVDSVVRQAFGTRRPFDFFHRIVRPHGSIRTLHGRGEVFLDPQGQPARMAGTAHDVTEQLEAEAARASLADERAARARAEERARLLQEVDGIKEEFVANASHDLKTPLTSIRGFAHLLERRSGDGQLDGETLREGLGVILSQAESMTAILDRMLNLSRVEAGVFDLDREACDLRACIETALSALEPDQRERVDVMLPQGDLTGAWDRGRLPQVLVNLLDNAFKYAPLDSRVTVTAAARRDGSILVSVSDRGVGLNAEEMARVFGRFYRSERNRGTPGTGLGLHICKRIIEAHGGRISAYSPGEGQGSTFTFILPRGVQVREGDGAAPRRPTVLVVDDEAPIRHLLVVCLEGAGYHVYEAATGEEALGLLDEIRAEAIVSDVRMPGIGGVEFVRRVREDLGLDKVIVFLTSAYVEPASHRADRFFSKPFDLDELVTALRSGVA